MSAAPDPKSISDADEAVSQGSLERPSPSHLSSNEDDEKSISLIQAVEYDDYDLVVEKLKTPQDLEVEEFGRTALNNAHSLPIVLALLAAGANIQKISHEGRRALVGLSPETSEEPLSTISSEQFLSGCNRLFGTKNPDRLDMPFWDAMIRSGKNAWVAGNYFKDKFGVKRDFPGTPVWCAERFGQSITRLPDGRVIQIGGEHEDSYDPDFCIYNDVWEHHPDGSFVVYSYPEDVFQPTDNHSATLMGGYIYVIGCLGYGENPRYDHTPVYKLDTASFAMEEVEVVGEAPGRIYKHAAVVVSEHEICVSGGKVSKTEEGPNTDNDTENILNISDSTWRRKTPDHTVGR
ncbi:hypothetical protein BU16DRAFT_186604 [Lophium mytilinum]|uniref:Ankyrin n=1 Tax=Lophium mytilinum TaxID=390894 RepID=A0A6A6R912_9PEZI|nr:hypothetical protein BU16DRAFT_186604 [Lophium mytilinum]